MGITPTLDSAPVRSELEAMLAAADAQEAELETRLATVVGDGPVDEAAIAPHLRDAWIAVPRDVGELLALLVRSSGARTVVEFGTSFGVSAVFLAAALRDNGGGTLVTSEIEESKAAVAAGHLAACGLDDLVDLRVGDALETLRELPGPVDLLLLDGWSPLYLPVLELVTPRLAPDAIVVADDTALFAEQLDGYFAHVRNPVNGFRSMSLDDVGDGVEVSLRTV